MSALLPILGLVFQALVIAEADPTTCCDFWAVDQPEPCVNASSPDHYQQQGCRINGTCDLNHVQRIEGHDYGTCICEASTDGIPRNTSSPHCCWPGTMGADCEFCNGELIPDGVKKYPSTAPDPTRCWPPDTCNTSVLSHTNHKGFMCDVHDPHIKAMLQAGFKQYSQGTVQTSVQCRGDFLRGNSSEENFDSVMYHCQNSTCDCHDCSAFVKAMMDAIHTNMYLQCWPNGTCWFWQQELLGALKINLTCTGSECIRASNHTPNQTPFLGTEPAGFASPDVYQGGIDDKALCEATFLLFHDKFWSRPINTEKVLKCHFRNCEKIIQHETPVPQPSYGIVSFVVVPIFLVVVGSILAMCYFSRLRYRQKYWTQTQSNRPQRIRVTCQDIGYQVTTKEGSRTILHPTSCHLQSGRTLAIMGSSGAGKTTFLDIVAGRLKTGSVTGCLLVNGVPLDSAAALQTYRQYVCAYVMQDDCLPAYLTTEECVLYSAKLRLPLGMPLEEKQARVEEVLEELGLSHVSNTRIGSASKRGLSGGEMKRVSIAMQMVIRPQMIVLDEPTSGLDSYNAHQVMEHLLKAFQPGADAVILPDLADKADAPSDTEDEPRAPLYKGQSSDTYLPVVAFSIHQPSEAIFRLFDQLMLFSYGRALYHGRAAEALPHFQSLGHPYTPGANPADWLLFLTTDAAGLYGADTRLPGDGGGGPAPPSAPAGLVAVDVVSPDAPDTTSVLKEFQESMRYYPEFLEQVPVLWWRVWVSMRRNPLLLQAHLVVTIILGLFVGVLYKSFDDCAIQPPGPCEPDLSGVWNRAGGFFFLLAFLSLGSMSVIDAFQSERVLFARERASGYYSTSAYLLPKLLLDFIPLRVVPALILGSIIYHKIDLGGDVTFGMGLRSGLTHFTWFLTIFSLFNVCASGMCITISAICPTFGLAALVSTLYLLFLMVFGGVYIRMDSMPESLHWMRYMSFFSSAFELLMVNEINGRTVLFNPVDANGNHMYSVPQTGTVFLRNMGLVPTAAQWKMDALLLLGLTVMYVVLAGLCLHFVNRERR